MKNIIVVDNLIKKYKTANTNAVDNISFKVEEGEFFSMLGPNGAGKTTTTKMLTGLVHPTSGSVKVLGFNPFDRKREFLTQIGLVMGNKSGLSWDLTGEQALRFVKEIYNIEEKEFQKSIKYFGEILDIEKYLQKQIRKLSLGERMKLELIGAILHQPKVLFLDEPTIGLDITSKKNIRKFLRDIQKNSNITILLTSHDMDDIETVCDRVIIINNGTKVYDENINDLLNNYKNEKFIKVYFDEIPSSFETIKNVKIERIEVDSVTFSVSSKEIAKFMTQILENFEVIDIDIISVPLEEIIEDIYKKK